MGIQILGLDLAVYLIVFFIGIPLFFFWRWIFKKFKSTTAIRILIWLATIITAPMLYVLIVSIFIYADEYYPNRDFDRRLWQVNKDTRYEYSRDLIKSKILLGKTKNEVLQILGKDTDTSQVNELGYNIGYRPELTGIDPSYLIIDFKNGKVDTVMEYDK